MATSNESTQGYATMGRLIKEAFGSAQEFADEIAAKLQIPSPVGAPGQGNIAALNTQTLQIPSGATYIDVPNTNCQGAILQIVNNTEAPTIGVRGVYNTNRVYFTGPSPTANYFLVVTTITIQSIT